MSGVRKQAKYISSHLEQKASGSNLDPPRVPWLVGNGTAPAGQHRPGGRKTLADQGTLLKGHTPGGVTFLSMYQTFTCVTFHLYQATTETAHQMKLDGCRVFTATDLQAAALVMFE